MKKIILLIALIFMISGCTVNYNLVIKENTMEENIEVVDSDFNTFPLPVFIDEQGASESNEKIEGIEYYKQERINDTTTFSYIFSTVDYPRSRAVNTCLKSLMISEENDLYMLNTTDTFSCIGYYSTLDEIKIEVTIDTNIYEVVNNNADGSQNDIYYWVVNRDNYKDKNIMLTYKNIKSDEKISTNNETQSDNDNVKKDNTLIDYILVGGVLLLFVIVILGIIKYKSLNKQQ